MDNTTNQVDTSTEAAGDEHEQADKEKDENEDNAIGLGIQRSNNVIKQYKTQWVFLKNIGFCQNSSSVYAKEDYGCCIGVVFL